MSAGFLLPYARYDQSHPTHWVSGAPEKSFWTGTAVKKRHVLPVVTHRCDSCGFLESYARG